MRIITGSAKGRKIKAPKGDKITRPALGKVREAIFPSLGSVEDKILMDIYAGTGSLGLEGLSRGAKKCYFIDYHPEAVACLVENIQLMQFDKQSQIFRRKLPFGLKDIRLDKNPDIIFCDPPYDKNLINKSLAALLEYKLIDPHSLVIVEHSPREMPETEGLKLHKRREYGQTVISFLVPDELVTLHQIKA